MLGVAHQAPVQAAAPATVDLATAGNVALRIDGAAANNETGWTLRDAGDVNNDGIDDILVGAASGNAGGANAAYVVWGGSTPRTVDLNALGTNGFKINGLAAGQALGVGGVAMGDLNGDGYDDVAVTSWGSAYVVFGKATTTTVNVTSLGTGGYAVDASGLTNSSGWSLDAGDVNGDGKLDLVMAQDQADLNARTNSGSVFVVFGKSSTGTVSLTALGAGGWRIDGATAGIQAGMQVAAGDVTGDGKADVLLSAPFADYNGRTDSGSAWVVFGKAGTGNVDLNAIGSAGYRIDGAQYGENVTSVSTTGDMNGDGIDDVLIGAPWTWIPEHAANAGAAYVVWGKSSTTNIDLNALGAQGFRIYGTGEGDQTGGTVRGAGDINGDGRGDVYVGAEFTDNNGRTDSGSAFVVFGKSSTSAVDLNALGTAGFRIDGAAANDQSGGSWNGQGGGIIADQNGDGMPDILTPAFQADPSARSNAGQAYVVSTSLMLPDAGTDPATSVGTTTATLNGTVNPNGQAASSWFQYGPTTAYGSTTASVAAGSGSSPVVAAAAVTGLTPDTVYHYRLVVQDSDGYTMYGADQTAATAPTVSGGAAGWQSLASITISAGGTPAVGGSAPSGYEHRTSTDGGVTWGAAAAGGSVSVSAEGETQVQFRSVDGGTASDWAPATATAASTARIDRTAPGTPGAAGGSLSWSTAASGTVTAQPGTDTGPTGLLASFFNNTSLTGAPVLTRIEGVDVNWGYGSPDPLVAVDGFSARWQGGVTAPTTGTYTFRTLTDDGVRLWVNGQLVIDDWTDHSPTYNTAPSVTLTAGRTYPVVMEYYEAGITAEAHLQWQTPGGGGFVAVPQAQLSPLTYEYRESTDGGTTWAPAVTGAQPTVSEQGETLVQFRATDAAGNVSGWGPTAGTAGATVRLDRTAPGGNGTSELVSNGTFETPAIGSGFQQGNAGQGYGAWTITSGSVDLYATSGGWDPAGGVQSLDMNGAAPGAIGQTLTTVPGTVYRLSFAIAGNPAIAGVKELAVDWGGTTVRTVRFDTTGHTTTTMGWTTVTLEATATSTSTALTFRSLTAGNAGVALDNVSVVPQTGPTVSGGSLSWQSVASVTVTGSAATDVFSGVSGYEYRTSTDGGSTWGTATAGASAVISAEGETLVQFRAVDAAGNAGDWLPASPTAASTVRIDRTAATAPTVTGGSLAWQNVSGITFSAGAATGGPSGLGSYSYRTSTDGGTTWGTPVTGGQWSANAWVSAAGQAVDTPLVGVDGVGDAVAVWLQYNGANSVVYTASRPAGGAWGAPTALTATGFDAMTPGLAVAPDGTAVATWSRSDGTQIRFQAAVRSAAGAWGAPTDLSAAGSSALNGVVAIDGSGNAVAAWEQNGIQSARYSGGTWSAPQTVGSSGATQAAVDMNTSGDTALVWRHSDGTNTRIEAATRSGAGAWSAVSVLSAAGQDASMPDVAAAASGDMTAAWTRSDGANLIAQTSERPTGGAWGVGVSRSAAGGDALGVRLAAHADGALVATWSRDDGTAYRVQVLERAPGGAWGAVTTLSDPGQNAFAPVAATSATGDAIVMWYRWDGSRYRVQSTTEASGGSWDAITTLSDTGATAYQSQVAMAPDGTAVGVWTYNAGPNRVQSSVRTPDVRATITAEGETLVQFRTADGAGNLSAWSPASATAGSTARIDRTAPTAPTVGGGSLSWLNQASTTVTASGATDAGGSALSGYEYRTSTDGGTTWSAAAAGSSTTVTAEGETLVQFRAVDGAGNTGAWAPSAFTAGGTVRLDRTAPSAPAVTGGSLAWQSAAAVAVSASGGTDAGGSALSGDEYRTSTDGGATWTAATSGSAVAVTSEGETLVQFRSVDGAANASGWTPVAGTAGATVRLDRTAPTAPVVGGGSLSWQSVASVDVTAGGDSDALSGIAAHEYRTSTDGGSTWSAATGGASVTVSAEGETLVQYRSLDNAGNASPWTPAPATAGSTVRIDRTDPTAPGVAGGSLAWQSVPSITITASGSTDAGGAALSGYQSRVSTDGGSSWSAAASGATVTVSAEGETQVQFRAVDGAGNLSAWTPTSGTAAATARINRTGPSAPTASGGSLSWQNVASITLTGGGATSSYGAIAGYEYRLSTDGGGTWGAATAGASVVVAAEGETLVQFRAIDDATNTGPWSASATARIDRSAPTAPTAGGGSPAWQSVATITLGAVGATDAVSGVTSHEYRTSTDGGGTWSAPATGAMVFVSSEGETLAQFRAVDAAGNVSAWSGSGTARIDRTIPTDPTVSGGSLTWQSVASVDVTASGSDGGDSGLAGYESRTSTDGGGTWSAPAAGATLTVGAEGETLVEYRAVDGAGNATAWSADAVVRLDRTAPGAPTVAGGSLSWQSVASVDVTAAGSVDALSGTAGYEYRLSTDSGATWAAAAPGASVTVSSEGETLVQFRALDVAGNAGAWAPASATAGSTVRINRTGPSAPAVGGGSLSWQSVASVTVSGSGSSSAFGALTGYEYRLSTDSGATWSAATAGASVVVGAEGETLVQFRALDDAGNAGPWSPGSATAGSTVRIDRTPPGAATVAGGSAAWLSVAAITLSASGSTGAGGYEYRTSTDGGATWSPATTGAALNVSAEGETQVQFRGVDAAGNTGAWTATALARIDRTAPSDPTVSGGSLTWTGLDRATVTAAGSTDPLSGVAGFEYRTSTDGGSSWSTAVPGVAVTVTAMGETLVQFRATDNAGNAGAWVPSHGGSPDPLATVRLAALGLGPQRQLSATGTPGDPGMDATTPDAALDTVTNQYLVVWSANTGASREVEVWGRMATGGGEWAGPPFRITHQGPDGNAAFVAWEPRVVYNAARDEYVVTWYGDTNTGGLADNEFEVYAQRLDATGATVGGAVRVSQMGPDGNAAYDGWHPAIAYDPATDRYLVVWEGDTNAGGLVDNEYEIWAQALGGDLTPVGGNVRVSAMGPDGNPAYDALTPAVAFNAVTGEYVVAWSGDTTTGGQVDNEYEIFSQRLTAAGVLTGPAVRVSHTGVDGDTAAAALTPAVVVDGSTGEALVAWSGDPGTGGLADDEFEIFTQRLSGAGAPVGAAARVSHMGPDGDPAADAVTPDVTWNAPADQYLVSWTGTPGTGGLADGESEMYVQRLLSDGSEYGTDDARVSVMGPDGDPVFGVGRGMVASGGDVPSFLAVWDGTDNTGGLVAGENEIHSRLLAVDPTAPTDPALGGGSAAWQNVASVTVTASGSSDPQSGLSGYQHRVSTDGGASWSSPAPGASVTVATEGETLVEFRAVNANGDQGGWVRDAVRIDRTTPPAPTTGGGSAAWQAVASLTITGDDPAEPSGLTYEHRLSTDGGATWSAPAAGAPVSVSAEGQTLVQFRAIDGAGNTSGWSASETARIDRTAPTDPTVSGGGPLWQNVASVTITAAGSTDAGGSGLAGYESRVSTDAGATWSAPATGALTTTGAEGETLVQARAVDGAGNPSGWVQATVRIDRGAPPAPTGLAGPAATNAPPVLTWSTTADAVSYVVTRDGTQVGTATGTTFTDPALPADGTHAYRVIAVDGAGNQSAPSAALNVDVDTVAPALPGGVAGGSLTWSNAASITITATPAGGTTLQYRLSTDGGTTWGAPSAGASATLVAEGETVVQFRALDAAGNSSGWTTVTASATARLDRTAPATPAGLTGAGVTTTPPVIGWAATAGADGYQITRNGTQIGTTTGTGYTDTTLPAGGFFTYRVIATDLAGNASAPSAVIGVTYTPADVIPPDTGITGAPAGPVTTASLTLGLTATEPSTYECNTDGAGWSACTTPWAVGPLADGAHTLAARARDLAGNTDPSPAQVTFTVDTAAPPVPTLTATADASVPLNSATGRVQLVTATSGDAVRVVVTEGARVAYDGPADTVTDGGLTDGTLHAYTAVAFDAAGNASSAVTASATTPDRTPPARPAAPGGAGSPLALTWATVPGASAYTLLRDGTPVTTTAAPSAPDPAGVDTAAPPTPGGLSANIMGDGRITLAWAGVADAGSAFTYTVRAQDAAGNTSVLSPGAHLLSTSGLSVYRVTLDNSPLADTAATTYSISGLPAGSGHTITLQAVDAAGNASEATAPINLQIPVTLASIPALRLTADHVYARPGDPVSFTALLGDPASSAAVHWTLAPGAHADGAQVDYTYASAGRRMVYATLTDTDGATTVAVLEVIVDATAPELTVTQRGDVLAVAASDADSGVQTLEWAPRGGAMRPVADGRIALAEGANRIAVRAVDRAGNVRQLTRDITLDTTAPTLAVRVPRLALGGRAAVTVTARDAGSGVATLSWAGHTSTAVRARLTVPVGRRVTMVLTDRAGNTSTARFTIPGAPGTPKGVQVAWNAGVPRLTGDRLRLLQATQRQLQVLARLPVRWTPVDRYTAVLAHAVRAYQLHGRLKLTGNVDAATRVALAREVGLRRTTITGR